jgi:hypothetical protein
VDGPPEEIELAHHAGRDNGKLQVRFEDFEHHGVRRHSIGPALNELEALGLIKITERGKAAKAAEYRRANKFLLTTRPELDGVGMERCGWRRFKTAADAGAAVVEARVRRENLKAASAETAPEASAKTAPIRPKRQCRKGTTTDGRNGTTIYISGGDAPVAPLLANDAMTPDDAFPSNALAMRDAAKLVWTKPIVRELFGGERSGR